MPPTHGARLSIIIVGLVGTVAVLLSFAATTLRDDPGTAIAVIAVLAASVGLDALWKKIRDSQGGIDTQ